MIYIKVEENTKRFIDKCMKNRINLYDIKKYDDYMIVLIDEDNLENILKQNYYSKITIVRYTGFKRILLNIKRYSFDILMLLTLIITLYIISNFVISIDILHENQKLIENINEILIKKDVKPFQYKKDLDELNEISDEILYENRDILDWIAIDRKGMKYIVSFEERILKQEEEYPPFCSIIAKKDGVIKKIIAYSGVTQVEKSMYVRKGDILIDGTIMNNEEVKDETCAKGEVFAEVWYKINISVPLNYQDKEYTDKNRYNFILNGNSLFKKRYEYYDKDKVFSLGPFKIIKEREYIIKDKKHGIEEAKNEGITLARKRILEQLGKKDEIISEKVLKEEINDSKIELEVFMSVLEEIGLTITEKVGDNSDTE